MAHLAQSKSFETRKKKNTQENKRKTKAASYLRIAFIFGMLIFFLPHHASRRNADLAPESMKRFMRIRGGGGGGGIINLNHKKGAGPGRVQSVVEGRHITS